MNFTFERSDNFIIFTIKNSNLDAEIAPELKAKILIICQPDVDAVIFDLTNIEYVDSSGLGALLLAYRQMKEFGAPIALVGVQELVMKMLNISQLEDLFEYYDTVDEAVKSLQN
jgi:anti-sigma B factor antagonist